jgi:hypothetical protein
VLIFRFYALSNDNKKSAGRFSRDGIWGMEEDGWRNSIEKVTEVINIPD